MKVKTIKHRNSFKPFKIEIIFETETGVVNLIHLLNATKVETEWTDISGYEVLYPNLKPLKDELESNIKQL